MNSGKMFDERLEPRRRTKTGTDKAKAETELDNFVMWWCVKVLFITAMIVFMGLIAITLFLEWLA